MYPDRVNPVTAEERLKRLRNLWEALGDGWIARESRKPVEQWSLIYGWLSVSDNRFWTWLSDLNQALGELKDGVSPQVWQKMKGKIRAHSDRANTKGTLSEVAMWLFLTKQGIPFDLEAKLSSGNRDVDIRADPPGHEAIYIEVQWVSPSASSDRGAENATAYGEAYPVDYDYEKFRIKSKVSEKIAKFTESDLSFVALDCTSSPELGGGFPYTPVGEALLEAFTGRTVQGGETGYADTEVDKKIRQFVDGVIWFELEPGKGLLPLKRGSIINPTSQHRNSGSSRLFIELWQGT